MYVCFLLGRCTVDIFALGPDLNRFNPKVFPPSGQAYRSMPQLG
jgi:hypothetical protein